jgi:hypothetical protein
MSRQPALSDFNAALDRRLHALETKRPLDLEAVERATARVRRPDILAAGLGDALRYSQRVEADVAGLGVESLLPHSGEDHNGRFLAVWVPDELGHAAAQAVLLDRLQLPVYEARPADEAPLFYRFVGAVGRISARTADMVSLAYHSIGAINERLAMAAYGRMAEIADEIGEHELTQALFAPMRRDESAHLGYYRAHARRLGPYLAPWQRRLVRSVVVHTYAPVGARRPNDKAPFGRTLVELEQDPRHPSIAPAVQQIAVELLAAPDQPLPPFVARSMRHCLDRADERARPCGQPTSARR